MEKPETVNPAKLAVDIMTPPKKGDRKSVPAFTAIKDAIKNLIPFLQ